MATLIANADANFTGAATWAATETGASALALIRANAVVLTTAGTVTSPTFTVTNGRVIDGVLLWLFLSSGIAGTGTFKVDLQKGGVSQASVTVNKSDLSNGSVGTATFFKFTGTATGDGGSNWTLVLTNTSGTGSGEVTYFRNSATTGDCTRALRTTTAATAAAADNLIVCGELTGAGTKNNRTVTMDSTAATDYGNGGVNSGSVYGGLLAIGMWGTLSYGVAAATNYILRLSGDLIVYKNGTLNIGSSGAEIPRDSTAVLEFDPVSADGDFGLRNHDGTINTAGLSRTVGKELVKCKLNTDEAINSTSLGVDTDTGWLDNDVIIVASTTRTTSQCERGSLNGAASSTTLTVDGFAGAGGGLAAAHSGTSPTQAEVGLLTRNVKIRSTSSTLMSYVYCTALSVFNFSWTEFRYIGVGVVAKRGIEIDSGAVAGAKSMTYCSFYDGETSAIFTNGASTSLNLTCSNNVFWVSFSIFFNNANINSDWTFENNLLMGTSGAATGFVLTDLNGTCNDNTVVGGASGFSFAGAATTSPLGSFDGNVVHSCASAGLVIGASSVIGEVSNFSAWRTSGNGIVFNGRFYDDLVFDTLTLFGHAGNGIIYNTNGDSLNIRGDSIISGDTTFAQVNGIVSVTVTHYLLDISGVDFSGTTSIFAPNTTRDIGLISSTQNMIYGVVGNCKFGAPTPLSKTNWSESSYVRMQRYNQTAGDHRTEMKYGQLRTDATIYNTAAPSMRMTPNSASSKLTSAPKYGGLLKKVDNGGTVSISVYVRKSEAGDGAAYNGNQPRLIQRANPALGQNDDVVLDTMSAAVGNWEQLTATSSAATDDGAFEFVVDCDGTTGWINVDDWA